MTEKEIKALKHDTNITSEQIASQVRVSTESLGACIYGDKSVKLFIWNNVKSPYGYTKRELLSAEFAVEANEFTFDYVKSKVDEVYSTFSNDEIHELLTKTNQYTNG
jgi:DNA-binding transcriptional regulator YiaG